jgi:hypothetical protein
MSEKKNFLTRFAPEFAGLCIGIQILLKWWSKLPHLSERPLHVGFIFLAGLFVTLGSVFHHRLEKRVRNVHALFHTIEGLVLATCAVLLFEEGKFRIPAFIFFIGCLYVVVGLVGYRINEGNWQRSGRRLLFGAGVACLLFGLTAIVLNLLHDANVWVFIIAAIFVSFGIIYTFFTDRVMARLQKWEKRHGGAAAGQPESEASAAATEEPAGLKPEGQAREEARSRRS